MKSISENWKEKLAIVIGKNCLRFLRDIKRAFEDDLETKRAFSSLLELLSLSSFS